VQALRFEPPRWLENRHLQSMLPSVNPRRALVRRRAARLLAESQDVVLDCGDDVRLLGHHAAHGGGAGDLALLVHGWEGSADSTYVLSCAAYLYERGFDIFRLNLRDHGPTHHLNPDLFHSCRIAEVVGAVRAVQQLAGTRRLSMIGYSLGGNFAMRVAVRAPAAGIALARVVAVCPVLDPLRTMARLEHGPWIYRAYFLRKWRSSLLKKQRAWPGRFDLGAPLDDSSLTAMTEQLVLRFAEYPDLATYLNGYAIVGPVLEGLAVPSRILTALDDPIIDSPDLARLATPAALRIYTTTRGGHCGFLENLTRESWADRRVHELLCDQEPPT
jgi:predicted alpha/beta-fold hydrolase